MPHGVGRVDQLESLLFHSADVLDGLPHLTALRYTSVSHLGIEQLIHFASHSTLEELHIDSGSSSMRNTMWIGRTMRFPISVEEDERDMRQVQSDVTDRRADIDDDSEAIEAALAAFLSNGSTPYQQLTSNQEGGTEGEFVGWGMHNVRGALTRTQPIGTAVSSGWRWLGGCTGGCDEVGCTLTTSGDPLLIASRRCYSAIAWL